jgi:hypothetical protein
MSGVGPAKVGSAGRPVALNALSPLIDPLAGRQNDVAAKSFSQDR